MENKMTTLQDLKEFVQSHLDFCHKVITNKIEGVVADDYWKGVQNSYANVYNAILKLEKQTNNE